jgi:hypothetical protein
MCFFNPFTGDFNLPKRKYSNGIFGSFSTFFIKIFNFGDVTKKVFFALSDAPRCGFEKNCATDFAK